MLWKPWGEIPLPFVRRGGVKRYRFNLGKLLAIIANKVLDPVGHDILV